MHSFHTIVSIDNLLKDAFNSPTTTTSPHYIPYHLLLPINPNTSNQTYVNSPFQTFTTLIKRKHVDVWTPLNIPIPPPFIANNPDSLKALIAYAQSHTTTPIPAIGYVETHTFAIIIFPSKTTRTVTILTYDSMDHRTANNTRYKRSGSKHVEDAIKLLPNKQKLKITHIDVIKYCPNNTCPQYFYDAKICHTLSNYFRTMFVKNYLQAPNASKTTIIKRTLSDALITQYIPTHTLSPYHPDSIKFRVIVATINRLINKDQSKKKNKANIISLLTPLTPYFPKLANTIQIIRKI